MKQVKDGRAWKIFNGVTIVVALIVVISFIATQGVGTLVLRLATLKKGWLLVALLCMGLFWAMESLLLHVISRSVYKDVKFSSSVHTVMIGQLYSALTPFSSGGQPVQLLSMQRDGMDAGGAGSALTLKSLTWQVGLTLYAIAGALYGWGFFSQRVPGFRLVFAAGVVVNLVVISAIIAFAASRRITTRMTSAVVGLLGKLRLSKNPDALRARAERQFAIFHQSMSVFANKPHVWIASALLTALQFLCYYLVAYAVYRSFGSNVYGVPLLISAVALVSLVASFVPLPGGSGGAEGAFYLYVGLFFAKTDLFIALLLWRLITYYSAILIGAVMIALEKDRPNAQKLHAQLKGREQE